MDSERRPEREILTRTVRLNARVTGVATGFVFGAVVFVATNWLVLKGGPRVGPHLALLGQFFIGYTVTFGGSLIGFAYGCVTGFVLGWFVAALYNRFADFRQQRPKASGDR